MQRTVLVVEDDEDLRDLVRTALERAGFVVLSASDGFGAFAVLQCTDQKVDIVLLDLLMPGMTGWTFCAELKSRAEFAQTPIVVHSSAIGEAPAGATRVLKKPISIVELVTCLRELCPAEPFA